MNEQFDNPYNPDTNDYQNQTKPLSQVIQDAIDAVLYELHTWLPAQVIAVRAGSGTVDIQPLLQRKYKDGSLVKLSPIQDVMVGMPSGADYWVKLPVAVGDTGIALFCERSLDNWSVSGGFVDPADPRKHDISDAIFIPGLRPTSSPIAGNATDLTIHNSNAEIVLQKAGKFKVQKVGGDELFALLSQFADAASQISNTGGPIFNAAAFTALKAQFDALKGS